MTLFKKSLTIGNEMEKLRASSDTLRARGVVETLGVLRLAAFFLLATVIPSTSHAQSKPAGSTTYRVDTKESLVIWKGAMQFFSDRAHVGHVSISKGELRVDKGALMGGSVVVDMNTITDPVHGSDNNLINHLKDPDFFDVKKFPTSSFTIMKVTTDGETINVTGNLTIKEITHEVTFPAKIEVKNDVVTATGKLTIDRTKWDVRYRSGKFFANLADDTIADEIEFEMKIVARKY